MIQDGTTALLTHRYAYAYVRASSICSESYEDTFKMVKNFFNDYQFLVILADAVSLSQREHQELCHLLYMHIAVNDEVFRRLVALLLRNHRLRLLLGIMQDVRRMCRKKNLVINVTVESSHELYDAERFVIQEFLAKKTKKIVHCNYVINQDLIAGIRIRADELWWEQSVDRQLREIAQSFAA